MQDIDSLNQLFAINNKLSFSLQHGMPVAIMQSKQGEAHVFMHGAHVTYYKSHSHDQPVIWMSEHAIFQEGKAIRGGIPICWPWFGGQSPIPNSAAHGFARNSTWEVSASGSDEESCWIELSLEHNENTLALWPHKFKVVCRIELSHELSVGLTSYNLDNKGFDLTQALHSYFYVGDLQNTQIQGLEQVPYIDTLDNWVEKTESASVEIKEEVDRIYTETSHTCIIHDLSLQREIHIAKQGSLSTVVWNPWIEKSQRMKDFGDNEYTNMVCIETANCGEDIVHVEPGKTTTIKTIISVKTLNT